MFNNYCLEDGPIICLVKIIIKKKKVGPQNEVATKRAFDKAFIYIIILTKHMIGPLQGCNY